jgi:hypothetical protein
MRRVLMVAAIIYLASPVYAEHGPAYPEPGSNRGPAYPKDVSPTDTNPANWIVRKPDTYGLSPGRYSRYDYGRHRRYR